MSQMLSLRCEPKHLRPAPHVNPLDRFYLVAFMSVVLVLCAVVLTPLRILLRTFLHLLLFVFALLKLNYFFLALLDDFLDLLGLLTLRRLLFHR